MLWHSNTLKELVGERALANIFVLIVILGSCEIEVQRLHAFEGRFQLSSFGRLIGCQGFIVVIRGVLEADGVPLLLVSTKLHAVVEEILLGLDELLFICEWD